MISARIFCSAKSLLPSYLAISTPKSGRQPTSGSRSGAATSWAAGCGIAAACPWSWPTTTNPVCRAIRRMSVSPDGKRMAVVLKAAAEEAGWGEAAPPGHGRGIACCYYHGTVVAEAHRDGRCLGPVVGSSKGGYDKQQNNAGCCPQAVNHKKG